MATHYRTKGIFLRKADHKEADQLFTVYTEDFGKIKVLGRAIRKITSKLRGGTDLFYLSEIEFIQGKSHKTLTDVILIDKFANIHKDLQKLRSACRIAEILNDLAVKEEKDSKVWELLNEVFNRLDNRKIVNSEIAYYYFFWNLTAILGYLPDISGCSIQGKKIDCDIVKILKLIFKKDWEILSRLKIEAGHSGLLKNISEWYKNLVFDENLDSL